jgi:hypothetical protein
MWDEVFECEFCGEPTLNEDCVCDSCLMEHLREEATLENAIAWGEEEKVCIEINGFVAWVLGASKINEKLQATLPEEDKKYAEQFCLDDIESFKEFLDKRRTA